MIIPGGYIKTYRKMQEHPVWQLTPAQFKVWCTILLMANFAERDTALGGARLPLPAGSFSTTEEELTRRAGRGITRRIVRGALRSLMAFSSIRANQRAKCGTIIEVVNWPIYQGNDMCEGQAKGQPRANEGPIDGANSNVSKASASPKKARRKEKNSSSNSHAFEGKNGLPAGFSTWWTEYPKKVGKIQALKAWGTLNPDEALQGILLDALRRHKATVKAMVEGDRQHILDPERWLKYRRWEDEVGGVVPREAQYPVL